MNTTIATVTDQVRQRSRATRRAYLDNMAQTRDQYPPKRTLSCGNLAHGYASCAADEKKTIRAMKSPHVGIITSYNDMLSAHQPLASYPQLIKEEARRLGCSAQVASGVPAMCDGITQGQPGMELSLFSRDVVAMATAVGLSHNMFDAALCLGVCDKIVPGMLIGALQFGHIPVGFVPGGPMPSGISNKEKAIVRQKYAEGSANKDELLAVESAAYHSPGTCTFYGTANSNQLLMEMLGLQLPGSSFINPNHTLRPVLTRASVRYTIEAVDKNYTLGDIVNESSLINALVGWLATGGSTNHTLHLVAIARAAGIILHWEDIAKLSAAVPLLARIYPNGSADINAFQQAGGMAFLVHELRAAGLLNEDVLTLTGPGLDHMEQAPTLENDGEVKWCAAPTQSRQPDVLTGVDRPFSAEGGIRVLNGNLGQSIIKVSSLPHDRRKVIAPCEIFHAQADFKTAFESGALNRDVVAVVRFQGARANGMPELHKLTPYLEVLQNKGHKVALVTDGRMSGASGKVPAAIHLTPEAAADGPIAKLCSGDVIALDSEEGSLTVQVPASEWDTRPCAPAPARASILGQQLFHYMRRSVSSPHLGASCFFDTDLAE